MGHARSSDGKLDVALSVPKEFGGPGGDGTNPEQLFAAGYGACFESVLRHLAEAEKKPLEDASITARIAVDPSAGGAFKLSAKLEITLEGLSREDGLELIEKAHGVCPYSNATRGNMDVEFELL
jgi:Ohr subfamily peroxiredoxin